MTRALAVTAAVLATAAACGGSSSGQPVDVGPPQHPSSLVGTVGKNDAFSISLTDEAGNRISNLVAGTYKLTVHDDSDVHNFHLVGGGIDDKTDIHGVAVKTYTITVKRGTYSFRCDSHPTQMKGSFVVR